MDGIHGLSCHYNRGRHFRHSALNDIVKRSLEAAKTPVETLVVLGQDARNFFR